MTNEEREAIKQTLLGPKKVATDSGTVEERSADDLKKGLKLAEELDAGTDDLGNKRPKLARLGFYGRINL